MKIRIAQVENLKGLIRKCPECGNEMTATGELYFDEEMKRWYIVFWCPFNEWISPVWSKDLVPLIEKLTKNIDPLILPSGEY